MKLSWSHTVINVRDLERMLGFCTDVLGFEISDRGPLGPGAPEIVFLSNDPDEHHQVAMVASRDGETAANPLNHMAFRVDSFEDVKTLHECLSASEDAKILPVSHGNTLSLYFSDPEGNGLGCSPVIPAVFRHRSILMLGFGLIRRNCGKDLRGAETMYWAFLGEIS